MMVVPGRNGLLDLEKEVKNVLSIYVFVKDFFEKFVLVSRVFIPLQSV